MKNYLLFLVVLMCMAFTCNPEETDTFHRTVKVTNNAMYPIYISYDWVGQHDNPVEYPWGSSGNKIAGGWNEKSESRVNPSETNTKTMDTGRPGNSIEGFLKAFKQMKVFFVDATKYDQIPIGSPIPNEVLLDSRVYDLEVLQAVNFHIHYPLPEE